MRLPLIFQNTSAGFGTLLIWSPRCESYIGLPRFHRAGPSTSLDKSAVGAMDLLACMIPQAGANVNGPHTFRDDRLGRLDSNQDPQIQSLVCCRCTTPQGCERDKLYHNFLTMPSQALVLIWRLVRRSVYRVQCRLCLFQPLYPKTSWRLSFSAQSG